MSAAFHRARLAVAAIGLSQAIAAAAFCPAFDSNGAAYLFTSSGDFSLGTSLSNATATAIATTADSSSRPSFMSNNTQCFTNQFTNGLYVLEDNSSTTHIFDFESQTWSAQQATGGPSGDFIAILDHDTVVLYAYSNGTMYALSYDQSGAKATSAPLEWLGGAANNDAPFPTEGYQPVLGAANNHIQFLNTPGSTPGQAYIFVIHYAYWQPEVQSFGDFPVSSGQTVTVFSNSSAAPASFAFIPDNGTASYVIDAKTNTTVAYTAPPVMDPLARYAASTTQLLQMTSNGTVAYLDLTAASGTAWSPLNLILPATNSTSTSPNSTTGVGSAGNAAPAANTTGGAASALGVSVFAGVAAVLLLAATETLLS